MRILLALWLSSGSLMAASSTVLVFIDSTLHSNVTAEVAAWTNQVNREGYYQVDLRERPRTWPRQDTNRLNELASIRTIIDGLDPAAVQFFGGVAMPVTGWQNKDGHGARQVDSDAPFMQDGYVPEDTGTWGTSTYGTNSPGDGYWDMLYVTTLNRPVARVAFLALTASSTNVTWGACLAEPQCPDVDEVVAFKDYLRRNLEYRKGLQRPARTGYITGVLWDTVAGSRAFCTNNIPTVTWYYNSTMPGGADGQQPMFLWENAAIGTEMATFFDSNCRYVRPFWVNTYRSFMMEAVQHGMSASFIRRWNERALVSTWGANWWTCTAASRTVFEAISNTFTVQGGLWDVTYQCWGDGTLPISSVPYAATATAVNVGALTSP